MSINYSEEIVRLKEHAYGSAYGEDGSRGDGVYKWLFLTHIPL